MLQEGLRTTLLTRYGCLRLFGPPDTVDDDGRVSAATLAEALQQSYLHHPKAGEAAVILDRRNMRHLGIYAYQEEGQTRYELTYLADDRQGPASDTVMRILGGAEEAQGARLPLGGRLTLYEIELDPLILLSPLRRARRSST